MKELIEFYWNEITQHGEFVYENAQAVTEEERFVVETKPQPLTVQVPTLEAYWGELIWYLKTQGMPL